MKLGHSSGVVYSTVLDWNDMAHYHYHLRETREMYARDELPYLSLHGADIAASAAFFSFRDVVVTAYSSTVLYCTLITHSDLAKVILQSRPTAYIF